jgi:predicted RNase H-like HicB family nuclease
MTTPRDSVEIHVEVTQDDDYGTVYVASNDELGLVTDGTTFETLLDNLREALAVCLDDTDTVAEFNLAPNPRVVIIMELPDPDAKTADDLQPHFYVDWGAYYREWASAWVSRNEPLR